ncbi:hypothetical protein RB195_011861 [Necator americanus]|uniref:Prominin n=1 Tax=Necator americanus TaxID=51031 RepID=A0ABR1D4B9_NECAM
MANSNCPSPVFSDLVVEKKYDYYYDVPFLLMEKVVDKVDERLIKHVAKAYYNPSTSPQVLTWQILSNLVIVIVAFVCLLLALSFLVASILSCGKSVIFSKRSSTIDTLVFAFISLAISIGITAVSVYYLFTSITLISDGHNVANLDIENAYGRVNKFLGESANSTICLFDARSPMLEKDVLSLVLNATKNLEEIQERFKYENITKLLAMKRRAVNTLQELNSLIVKSPLPRLTKLSSTTTETETLLNSWTINSTDIDKLKQMSKSLKDEFLALITYIKRDKTQISAELDSYRTLINETIADVVHETGRFKVAAKDVQQANDITKQTINYMLLPLLVPVLQIIFALAAIITLIMRYNIKSGNNDDKLFGDTLFNLAGHGSIIIIAVLFLLLASFFAAAYVSMYLCKGFTKNSDFNDTHPPAVHSNLSVDLIGVIQECQKNSSIVSATKIEQIWSYDIPRLDELVGKIGVSLGKCEVENDIQSFATKVQNSLNDFQDSVKGMDKTHWNRLRKGEQIRKVFVKAEKELHNFLTELNASAKSLGPLLTTASRKKLYETIIEIVSFLKVNEYATMEQSTARSPQCKPIVVVWTVMGSSYCSYVTPPVQGLWPTCVICAIGTLFLYFGLCMAGSYKRKRSKRARKKKQQFAQKTTLRPKPSKKGKKKDKTRKKTSKQPKKKSVKKDQSASKNVEKEEPKEESKEVIPANKSPKEDLEENYEKVNKEVEVPTQQEKQPNKPQEKSHSLPSDLVESIRKWKPPTTTLLTHKEQQNMNLRTQDEEEIHPPLLPFDQEPKKSRSKSIQKGNRYQWSNWIDISYAIKRLFICLKKKRHFVSV